MVCCLTVVPAMRKCLLALLAFLLIQAPSQQFAHGYKLIRFGGAGIFFWWQAGAAKYLQERCPLQETQFLGASAGAIAASLLVTNASFDLAAEYAINQAKERDIWSRKTGLKGIWGSLVEDFMQDMIPSEVRPSDLQRVHVMVTPRLIFRGTKTISNLENRQDLIDAVMASIHIPFFMDDRPWRPVQGKQYLDGSFWAFVTRRPTRLPRIFRYDNPAVDILSIDHKADKRFVAEVDTNNIVKLVTPDGLHEMMHYGYNYMADLDREGKLLFPTSSLRTVNPLQKDAEVTQKREELVSSSTLQV